MKNSFSCTLLGAGPKGENPMIEVPFDTQATFGTRGRVPVKVTLNGVTLRLALVSMGGGSHVIGFSRANAEKAKVKVGDKVRVVVERDEEERTVEVPPDLAKLLKGAAKKAWDKLSYTHRREHVEAITGAKKPETRARRIAKMLAMLTAKES